MPVSIEKLSQKLLNHIIAKQSLLNNYPQPGVIFVEIAPVFNDPHSKKSVLDSVLAATKSLSYDCVAGIASRGYIFSGLIANQSPNKGEQFIQKVKVTGDPRYDQFATTTEYSSDELQVLKGIIQKDKNYLVTDDLIATGGSALSAVRLIRDSGGQVNTVFVMTELVSFGARELLKKAGIELVSVLKLTNDDLKKLLAIQEAYSKDKTAPIPYQLSHHEGELTPACAVHVASQSALKKAGAELAVQEMLDPLSIIVFGHDVSSDVSKQPFGYEETARGALNRLKSMRSEIKNADDAMLISIENGLRYAEDEDKYYDFVQVVIEKDKVIATHTQDCCVVPKEFIREIAPLYNTTWGEIAERKKLVKSANNPHQEAIFGGMSRKVHIQEALKQALKKLDHQKDDLMTINRLAKLSMHQSHNRYAQRGIIFSAPAEQKTQNKIDLYNQGFPEKAKQNEFKIFDTGDAFSIVSPEVEFNSANVNVHVGVKHKSYSPVVLLHEGLQLCRCAHEHGAKEITVALPEEYNPVLYPSDFNVLLLNLFKVSGASSIYFYDQTYDGKLTDKIKNLSCEKEPVLRYLQWNPQGTLDEKFAHQMRKHAVTRVLSQCGVNKTDIDQLMSKDTAPPNINVPVIQNPQHILLCCSANQPFAKEIAESLKARGETVKVYYVEGEGAQAVIPSEAKICGATVTIVQSTRPNPDNINLAREYKNNGASSYFFEAIMIARQAHLRGADEVILVNPYQVGARSDKAENSIKGKTGANVQLNGSLLEAAGVNHVITAECHDPHTLSGTYTGKKIQGSAVQALTLISKEIAEQWLQSTQQGQFRLVMPDAGAAKRTKELTQTLQAILKSKLCDFHILGEKGRGSHKDDSALITNLNLGSIGVNTQDKYLITDDETATGSTLCQAIQNLKKQGAQDISVAIVHNNMPLDWLLRQLSLARFLFLGVNDLHFSNTQEMGTLAKNYDDLIQTYSRMSSLSSMEVESQVLKWFKENLPEFASSWDSFKTTFSQISTRVMVHNLADAFVDEFSLKVKAQLSPIKDQRESVYKANTLFSLSKVVDINSQETTLEQRSAGYNPSRSIG